eukprot:8303629-Pyramimonas_sp.AAC.1
MPGSSLDRSAFQVYGSVPVPSSQQSAQPLPVGIQTRHKELIQGRQDTPVLISMPEQMQTPATQAPTTEAPQMPPSQVTPQPPRREADGHMTVDSSSSVAATSVAKSAPRTELLTKEQAKVYESEFKAARHNEWLEQQRAAAAAHHHNLMLLQQNRQLQVQIECGRREHSGEQQELEHQRQQLASREIE